MSFPAIHRFARIILLASGAMVIGITAVPAYAQSSDPDGGLYVTGRIGVALPSDFRLEGVQDPQAPSPGVAGAPAVVDTQFQNEVTFSGAVGYRVPTRILGVIQPSFEIEYSYTNPDVSGGSFNGASRGFSGDAEVQTFTANVQADLLFKDKQRLVPFIGAGIGVADIDADIVYLLPDSNTASFRAISDDTRFVYQADAGLRFDLNKNLAIDARVRYQRVDGVDFERRFFEGTNNAFNANVSDDFETVNFLAGIRYSF